MNLGRASTRIDQNFKRKFTFFTAGQAAKKAVVRCEAEKEHELLMQQIEEKRQRILRERRAGIDLDRKNEAIQAQMDSEAIERDNVERIRRITRYTQLEELATNQFNRAEEKIRQLNERLEGRTDDITSETDVHLTLKLDNDANTDGPLDNLDALNQNTIDGTRTMAARRNRDHMKASSIVWGNTVAGALTSDHESTQTSPLVDSNSNRVVADGDAATAAGTAVILPINQSGNDTSVGPRVTQDVNSNFETPPSANHTGQESCARPQSAQETPRSNGGKLRASLSLELKSSVEDEMPQLTPMSTTSDHILDSSDPSEPDVNHTANSKISSDEFMSADGSPMQVGRSSEASECSPPKQLPTAKSPIIPFAKAKVNHFLIKELTVPPMKLPNAITSTPNNNNRAPASEQQSIASKYSLADVRDLHFSNLTNFLQKSFSIPLHAHFSLLNNEILKIFLCDLDIFSHFGSLRNYFLMMDSEFANQIFVGLMEKLETVKSPNELVNSGVLHSILGNALHSNVAASDKNSDNLSFAITNISKEWHRESSDVLNPILLSYHVEWPLNLVLGAETIEHYGYIFQYLLKIRRVAWVLEQLFFVSDFCNLLFSTNFMIFYSFPLFSEIERCAQAIGPTDIKIATIPTHPTHTA